MQITTFILSIYFIVVGECQMQPFVVHGGNAHIVDFPYSAYLGIQCKEFDNSTNMYCCGSSILNQYLTLTAAHCLFYCLEGTHIAVSVGHEEAQKAAISSAHSFVMHEQYCQKSAVNDIALVRLKSSIKFNERVSRVALMPKPPYDQEARLAGWGLTDEHHQRETVRLKYTTQRVWSRKHCLKTIKSMPKGTFCAGSKSLRGYASIGDSGSALVVRNYIQIGIVSYKKPDISKSMVIFTDTGYFYKWIVKNAMGILCAR